MDGSEQQQQQQRQQAMAQRQQQAVVQRQQQVVAGGGDEAEADQGEYAQCVHALTGHRNRSYPIRSALHVGVEYARGGALFAAQFFFAAPPFLCLVGAAA